MRAVPQALPGILRRDDRKTDEKGTGRVWGMRIIAGAREETGTGIRAGAGIRAETVILTEGQTEAGISTGAAA